MNDRIRKLADKIWAEEYWNNPNTDKLLPARLNKFAELIVRECVDIVADAVDQREPASTYVGKIKEYFGVEE
jgi:hypothetical protein